MGKKAINKDGNIEVHNAVPSSFSSTKGTVIGGGQYLTDEQAKEHGWYDVVMPSDYDERIHNLSDIFFSEDNDYYTYTKTNKTFSDSLSDLKSNKIGELKIRANSKLQPTDWYVIRKAELGTDIPSDITTARASIKSTVETKESEINSLTKKSDVIIYNVNID